MNYSGIKFFACILFFFLAAPGAKSHEIYFCNEAIPTSREFVANKLMNVIRNQMPVVTLRYLRFQAQRYFPAISAWLKYYGLPDDLKYIPIVECGFRNVSSDAGARGFWQLMPDVARELGLTVTPLYDERDDPGKSTIAACKLLRSQFFILKNKLNISSWILTAAAYNFGPGNIIKAVQNQGTDYFNMKLNNETAEYVYRLIAVKELFEHPELYMNGFGANIFSGSESDKDATDINKLERGPAAGASEDESDFVSLDVQLTQDGKPAKRNTRSFLVPAKIVTDGKPFRDGSLLSFELLSDLRLDSQFKSKGSIMRGQGWLIDGRVYVDMGYGHEVEVQDKTEKKGLSPEDAATDDEYVILKTEIDTD
ncbi:MAG: lytic transglycosylase domain-containing protein [Bacteroidetes bacterium]|nr:lytic transglycosylase domain-containing protein [Bacteroidota bacterium]